MASYRDWLGREWSGTGIPADALDEMAARIDVPTSEPDRGFSVESIAKPAPGLGVAPVSQRGPRS